MCDHLYQPQITQKSNIISLIHHEIVYGITHMVKIQRNKNIFLVNITTTHQKNS